MKYKYIPAVGGRTNVVHYSIGIHAFLTPNPKCLVIGAAVGLEVTSHLTRTSGTIHANLIIFLIFQFVQEIAKLNGAATTATNTVGVRFPEPILFALLLLLCCLPFLVTFVVCRCRAAI